MYLIRTSLRSLRFKISQCVHFWAKNPQKLSKICKKGTNCDSKLTETQACKDTCYITKKSCIDGGNPTKNQIFD